MTDQRENNNEFQRHEEELNLFLDGELSFDRQADLYSHLAEHPESRSFMDSILLFRRMSRQEFIAVPPAADDEFFDRLATLKASKSQIDRVQDREPLWNLRKSISMRTALATVVAVFMVGLLLPISNTTDATSFLEQEEERVFFDIPQTRVLQSYIYVFVPGLTIEADDN